MRGQLHRTLGPSAWPLLLLLVRVPPANAFCSKQFHWMKALMRL